MKISSSLPVAFALLLGISSTARADGPSEDAEQAVLAVIDAARAQAGVLPLRRNAALDEAALMHAEDMAENGFVGHESETTGDPIARVQSVGFPSARVGENVGRASTPADAANRMFASDAHREQMVAADYTDVGVAVVEGADGFYVVEVFAARTAPEIPPPVAADVPVEQAMPIAAAVESEPLEQAMPVAAAVESAQVAQAMPVQQPFPLAAATGGARVDNTAAGAPPTVVLSVAPPANVQGYWVQHQGAWWFYAVPAGARPGTVLSAVPGGQGPSNAGTHQLPVTAQPNQGPVQHYVAQPSYGQTPYAQPTYAQPTYAQPTYAQTYAQPTYVPTYAAPAYTARTTYVVQQPRPRHIVRAVIGANGRGMFGHGLLRSPRRPH